MNRPTGTPGFEPGVSEATRRALLDLDRRIRDGEGGSGGSSGDTGPHDHDEYALVEHDHDYLPLTGGTVTGDLEVAGNSNLVVKSYAQRGLVIDRTANENVPGLVELMPSYEADVTAADIKVDGNGVARFRGDKLSQFYGDLQVDGQIRGPQGTQAAPTYSSVNDPSSGFYAGNFAGNPSAAISVDGVYRVHVGLTATHIVDDLQVDGTITDVNGPVRSFGIADGIDTADVLDRAETATMPVIDDEGVATTDAEVESITVNEVVTALLAKVKEQSEQIAALSARIDTFQG